jgi:uncharacterized protein YndB with AHSA1/START domain
MDDLSKHNLTIEKTINAPVEKVWKAWTDPTEVAKWWGPRGVTTPECVWEAHPGGRIDVVMLAGESLGDLKGRRWPMTGQFQEVEYLKKLVYSGQAIMDDKPVIENLCTVFFERSGDQTNLKLEVRITKATPEAIGPLSGMAIGWNQSLDKLTEQVEG